jgi:hypothetical protein
LRMVEEKMPFLYDSDCRNDNFYRNFEMISLQRQ